MKLSLRSAASSDRTKFDLSSTHITTADFGTIQPTYIAECVPGDEFHVRAATLVRCSSLPVPTFGDINLVQRAYFVPMRSIFRGWTDFIVRSKDTSLHSSVPTLTNRQICTFFADTTNDFARGVNSELETPDFRYAIPGFSTYAYRFTSRGRWAYKILLSLGYSINFASDDVTEFSMLPLLAFMRVLYDYVFPSRYVQSLGVGVIFEERTSDDYSHILDAFKKLLYCPLAQDYFTAAWESPNMVSPDMFNSLSVTANESRDLISGSTQLINSNASDTGWHSNGSNTVSASYPLTAYALRVLQATSDFMTRNNIVGSRYFEQMIARFGIKGPKVDPDRSVYVDAFKTTIRVQDITSVSETDKASLGDLGGKATGGNDYQRFFDYSSQDSYGYFLVLSHLSPDVFYYQGRKRHTLHINPFHFYTPEYDKVGLQAIRNDELYADFKEPALFASANIYGGNPSSVFGFSPRYSEYKKRDDYLTGDFRVPSANVGLDSYHLGRNLPTPSELTPLTLNSEFLGLHQFEFDRIFNIPSQNTSGFQFLSDSQGRLILYYYDKPVIFTTETPKPTDVLSGRAIIIYNDSLYSTHYQLLASDAAVINDDTFELYGLTAFRYVLEASCFQIQAPWLPVSTVGDDLSYLEIFADSVSPVELFLNGSYVSLISLSTFQSWVQEYFDHFIISFGYNVQAYRKMLSISESMPIFSSEGQLESVDYQGVHQNQ